MLGDSYRAQLQRRVAGGRAEDICGPRRGEKRKAEEDLEALRAAAEQAGPDAAWSAMADVSQCLQERAWFEALVSLHLEQGVSLSRGCSSPLANSENQSLDMDDTQLSSVDEYYNDSNELWQEIDDTGQLPDWKPAPTVPVADPKTRSKPQRCSACFGQPEVRSKTSKSFCLRELTLTSPYAATSIHSSK